MAFSPKLDTTIIVAWLDPTKEGGISYIDTIGTVDLSQVKYYQQAIKPDGTIDTTSCTLNVSGVIITVRKTYAQIDTILNP